MPEKRTFENLTFGALDKSGREAVYDLFNKQYQSGKKLSLDATAIFYKAGSLSLAIDYYGGKLNKINPASFKFLNDNQRKALLQELMFSFYIFSEQYSLDEAMGLRENLKDRAAQIQLCAALINDLRKSANHLKTPANVVENAVDDSEKCVKYLGLTLINPVISDKMFEICSGKVSPYKQFNNACKIKAVKDAMTEVNFLRLYWVWGGNFLTTIISLLPDEFANKKQAESMVSAPAKVTGYMSWILYYARFGINLSLLLRHTLKGPWMSKAEAKIPFEDRFKTQWQQRKFSLLNDSIWGVANMACFYWLVGSGFLGYIGNVVTTILLVMDIYLNAWQLVENSTKHNADIETYNKDIEIIRGKIADEKNHESKKILALQLDELLKAKKHCEFEWQHKKNGLVNDLVYASALIVAFTIMCSLLFPPLAAAPVASLILSVIGASLTFMFTVTYSAIQGNFDIVKSKTSQESRKEECFALLERFNTSKDDMEKKQLYLEMKQLLAEHDYQKEIISSQKMKLLRSVFIDALIPPLLFVSFVFMPLGIGLAVTAAGLALAVISNIILKKLEPKAYELPKFDDREYEKFASAPEESIEAVIKKKGASGFFAKKDVGKTDELPKPDGNLAFGND